MPKIKNPQDRNAMAFKAACAVLPAVYAKAAEDSGYGWRTDELAEEATNIATKICRQLMAKFAGE